MQLVVARLLVGVYFLCVCVLRDGVRADQSVERVGRMMRCESLHICVMLTDDSVCCS